MYVLTDRYQGGQTDPMPECLNANQLVAYNLMRIRKTLGLSQEQAAARIEPYLGVRWSKAVYSAAERSYHGTRVRQFTADDLIALALAFGVPVAYFFLPPRPDDRKPGAVPCSGGTALSWPRLFEAMFGGEMRAAFLHRAYELPGSERPAADSYLARLINGLALPTSLEDGRRLRAQLEDGEESELQPVDDRGAESHDDHGT